VSQHKVLFEQPTDISSTVASKWLAANQMRLDASFYIQEAFKARQIVARFPNQRMDQVTTVTYPYRFKRIYSDRTNGLPFLSATEALFFRPSSTRYLSKTKVPEIEQTIVKKGSLLLTRSGTVGRVVYVHDRLSRFAITDDLLRIVPLGNVKIGYVYAFLASWMGQSLLTKDQYGSAVKHLEPEHVNRISIPVLSDKIQEETHKQILQAYGLREKANSLLDAADELMHTALKLPQFIPSEVYSYSIRASELDFRFDATYHTPEVRAIVTKLRASGPVVSLGPNVKKVFLPNRFKRVYVSKAQGVPFLSGRNIVEIKPYDIKYISSKVTKHLDELLIKKDWILVTRSGTIGRVTLVPRHWEEWAATEHLLRVIPDETKLKGGYLAAFLMNPLGYRQVVGKTFGGVVHEISEDNLRSVFVPLPRPDIQSKISEPTQEAFQLKEEANRIEHGAISTLENELVAS